MPDFGIVLVDHSDIERKLVPGSGLVPGQAGFQEASGGAHAGVAAAKNNNAVLAGGSL
jgi:hypothetical protein